VSKTFTLGEVNALELSAAENATSLERERIIRILRSMELRAFSRTEYMENLEQILFLINDRNVL